ncbi:MAG: hypothetical protein J7513_07910 [Solirubrobacteraceae bacterium]|nr:hypothetical protein [Solirubrobacteraceae bacterium]
MAPAADLYPFEHGLTWVMREWMRRGSSAVVADGKVWLIDPVDVPEAIEHARQLGEFGGVIQLLDRHPRACHALAQHYDIPLYRLPDELPIAGVQVFKVVNAKRWRERALWFADTGTLVVAELLGTNEYFALSGDTVGVHPMLRQARVKVGDHLPVQHLLVGHGKPVHTDAATAIAAAYQHRRRDALLIARGLRAFVGNGKEK